VIRNIANGFMWGVGFSISTSIILSLWLIIALPKLLSLETSAMEISQSPETKTETVPFINDFGKLSLDEKIAKSTAIIVTKIEKNDAGKYQSKVSEILKKQDNVELYYEVGDIYDKPPYFDEYESLNRTVPEGFIIFMSDNPARMRYSTSYSGERVGSLGNISLALLRQKCAP